MHSRSTRSRCPRPRMSIRSRHSVRTVLTQRSAKALARGDRTGVLITRMPSERNTSSKLVVNLVSRSRIRNLIDRPLSTRSLTTSPGKSRSDSGPRLVVACVWPCSDCRLRSWRRWVRFVLLGGCQYSDLHQVVIEDPVTTPGADSFDPVDLCPVPAEVPFEAADPAFASRSPLHQALEVRPTFDGAS